MRLIRGDSLKNAIQSFHEADRQPGRDPGERALALRQLIRRFVDVCNALAYAHSRGVLHRDLKPGNIMLGPYGETLVVDWGLAKVVGRPVHVVSSAEGTLRPAAGSGLTPTELGSAVGTPAYMSPEQAAGEVDKLGPASDVYSLGAMLFTLLTGRVPFTDPDPGEILRKVQAGEVSPPRQVNRTVPPALEAICLKAMAREPVGRYASPKTLADEIEHWLADEPVTAYSEPLSVHARRWMRRHRTGVAAALVALVAGVVGLGTVAGVQARANRQLREADATKERALKETQKAQAETQAALAQSETSRQQAEESRQRAEAVSSFLVSAFRSPDPSQTDRDIKVADVLDKAAEKLDKESSVSAVIRGALLDALGLSYRGLGQYDKAVSLLTKARVLRETALGPDHPDTLKSGNNLASACYSAGRLAEAIALHEATLKLCEARLGPHHPDTLINRHELADDYYSAGRLIEAIALHESTLKLLEANLGPDDPLTLTSRNNLALSYAATGRLNEAIALLESTLKLREVKLGPDHLDTLKSRQNLAIAYFYLGRFSEAIVLDESTLRLFEAKSGPDHPDTLNSRNNLANDYNSAGRLTEAIVLHESTLKLYEAKLGTNHPDTLRSRENLAIAYAAVGRITEAITLFEATLKRNESEGGSDHPDTLISRNNLADAYRQAGRLSDAMALMGPTLERIVVKMGSDHPLTLECRNNLGKVYEAIGRWSGAEDLYRLTLAGRRKTVKPDNPFLASDCAQLGHLLLDQLRWSEAEPLLREALDILAKATPDDWRHYAATSLLGGALLGQGRLAEAESLIVPGYEGMKAREAHICASDRFHLREATERLVHLYEAWERTEKATEWKAKVGLTDLPLDVFAPP